MNNKHDWVWIPAYAFISRSSDHKFLHPTQVKYCAIRHGYWIKKNSREHLLLCLKGHVFYENPTEVKSPW